MNDQYLHGHHESVLRSHAWRTAANSASYLLPSLQSGMRVLDVGCGPATITIDIARLVAPGEIIGIEPSEEVLDLARSNAADAESPDSLRFQRADVYALPFTDDSFDVVHAHQVLQHLSDPVAALVEMRRVCAPGGVVAARDADYGAMTWFPEVAGISQWQRAYRETATAGGYFPDAGRMLKSWALEAGFAEVNSSGDVWCYASDAEVAWWSDLWADRVMYSGFAGQAIERGVADRVDLQRMSDAWREWGTTPDAWCLIPHGEILARS
ncbi:MAG: methyltransferase domain-containing protein [Cumulibacter sp.]